MTNATAKTTFGASVIPNPPRSDDEALRPPPMLESPALTPAASRDDMSAQYLEKPAPPSPFYQHPPASFERVHSRQNSKTGIATYEKDLESGNATPLTAVDDENPFTRKISVDCNKECKMWPSKQTLRETKLAEKKRRRERKCCAGCSPVKDAWIKLNHKQKLFLKVAFALLIIGIIVAIGVGISRAVNGTYYDNGSQQQVGAHHGGSR